MKLLESEAVVDTSGHIILKQRLQQDDGSEVWYNTDMSEDQKPDESGYTNEYAFLLGLGFANDTTADDVKERLKAGETIYLVKPPEQSLPDSATKPIPQ